MLVSKTLVALGFGVSLLLGSGLLALASEQVDRPVALVANQAGSGFTYDMYLEAEVGMPYEKIAKIMGSEGFFRGRSNAGPVTFTEYQWANNYGSEGIILITFKNGKAFRITQAMFGRGRTVKQ